MKLQYDFLDFLPYIFWLVVLAVAIVVCLILDINIAVLIGIVIFGIVGFAKELTGGKGFK